MNQINPYRHGGEALAFDGFGNRSRDFNGVDNHVSIPDFEHSLTNLSCMCWVKSSDSAFQSFFSHWDTNNNRSWLIQLDSTDGLLCAVRGDGASNYKIYYTPDAQDTIADGTWHHVGFTYSNNDLRLYIDGLRVPAGRINKTLGDNPTGSIKNSTADILIGADISSSVPANFVDSSIADCRIYDATLTEAEITDIYNGTNITTNLVGHWLTDADNVLDAAGTNHATNYGTKYSYDNPSPPVEFGSASRDFNGSSDYIDLGDSDDLSFGDGVNDSAFSVCAWVKAVDISIFRILAKEGGFGFREWQFTTDGVGRLSFFVADNSSNTLRGRKYSSPLSTNIWYAVSMTYDGRGGDSPQDGISLYVNGSRVDDTDYTEVNTYVAMHNTTQAMEIGRIGNTYADGNIADVRLYDTDLTASQVSDLYSGTDVQTNLVGHWLTDNDDVEDKAGTNDGTNFGSTYSYDNPPMDLVPSRQASRSFDGTSDYVNTNASFNNVFNSNFTFACWAKCDDGQPITTNSIFGNQNNNPVSRFLCGVLTNGARVAYYNVDGNVCITQTQATLSNGQSDWFHFVVTVTPSGNSIYLDGSLQALDATNNGDMSGLTMGDYNNSTANCFIGARSFNNSPDLYVDGNIADVRIYDTDLTASQILAIYNGTTDRTNLVGQWLTNSDDVIDHAGTNDGTNNGSTYSNDSPS